MVCRDPAGRFLLTLFEQSGHPDSGSWTLPGGGMEWGEQAHETALRELLEETGLEATLGPLIGVKSEWFDAGKTVRGRPGHALRLVFEVTNATGELKQDFSDDDTTSDAAWFTLAEVHQLKRLSLVDFAIALLNDMSAGGP